MAVEKKHLVSVNDLTVEEIEKILEKTKEIEENVASFYGSLSGKILCCLFYEPSTRTNCSFVSAMYSLGGQVIQVSAEASSVKKGETLSDTVKSLECYADAIVLRHPGVGSSAEAAAALSKATLFNAGDGIGEHPTQALLDLYTIINEVYSGRAKFSKSSVEPLRISFVGDLANGRTVHSIAVLAARYFAAKKVKLTFSYVAPTSLQIPGKVEEAVNKLGFEQEKFSTLSSVLKFTDVLYMTRIQKERFDSIEKYETVKDLFILSGESLKSMKTDAVIMHPLPRVNEITTEVDDDPRAAYFRQMQNGKYVRMALLLRILQNP
eukprot:augustus_masked-scaffold_35-processed-gene-2.69-mRNA-1 protein AED:0.01 eAED:0.01 QI:0/-1/0/1/-1/1/1/0/321